LGTSLKGGIPLISNIEVIENTSELNVPLFNIRCSKSPLEGRLNQAVVPDWFVRGVGTKGKFSLTGRNHQPKKIPHANEFT
jgi:hypothetical protein